MKFPSPRIYLPRLSCAAALMLAAAGAALACGPDFPNSYLNAPEADLLKAPPGGFKAEITRLVALLAPPLPPFKTVQAARGTGWDAGDVSLKQTRASVLQAEVDDLRGALAARGDSAGQIKIITEAYAGCRQTLEAWNLQHQSDQSTLDNPDNRMVQNEVDTLQKQGVNAMSSLPKPQPPPALDLPAGLPDEFTRYFQSVVAWDEGKKDDARKIWTDLLALPPEQRHYRSTWAAFMLARSWAVAASQNDGNEGAAAAAKAIAAARQVRALAGAGFSDPLGLAEASLGWEAKAALATQDYATAINLYFAQQALGDATALESLRSASAAAANNATPEQMLELAKDPASRGVLGAFLVTTENDNSISTDPQPSARWATALDQAKVSDQPQADRFAWVAYQGGQFALARQWAALAPENSAIAEWVRAQLALRAGNLPEGEKHLRGALAAKDLAAGQRQLAFAELGRACLAQDRPADALLAWIDGGHEEDAAYLAERVLKLDELRAFVDAHCPAPQPGSPAVEESDWNAATSDQVSASIRALLARRLARSVQPELAEPYFSDMLRPIFHAYLADVRLGFDISKPAADRAAAFWRAAQTARKNGMDLLGTELEPDWKIWADGEYVMPPLAQQRLDLAHASAGGVLAPTPDELARLAASTIPALRFHYRYRAADLAWWAASLLPNDADDTAKILNAAGGWLKDRDPAAAEKFYQALVIRCGHTALGQAAAKAHWFPPDKSKAAAGSA